MQRVLTSEDYKVKTVHINGQAVVAAVGTVKGFALEDVDFLNTARVSGNLLITKNVNHHYGTNYQVPDNITFTAKVELANVKSDLVNNKTFTIVKNNGLSTVTTDGNGTFTVELKKDETVTVRDIPEDTTYKITEINLPAGFDLNENVSRALTGVIDANVNAHAILVNEYTAQPVSPEDDQVNVQIIKALSGRAWKDTDAFSFEIFRMDVNGATINGVTYDSAVYDITVTVVDDKVGQLHASYEITQNGQQAAIIFNNSYAADPIELEISLFKSIVGREMKAGEFKFRLIDVNHGYKEISNTVDGAMGEKLTFKTDKIFAAGTYHYHIVEENTELGGINYDETVYGVTIVVEDDHTTGKLKEVSRTIYKNGEEIVNGTDDDIVFNNVYDALDATVVIDGEKKLENRDITSEDVFEFELYQVINGTPELKQTVRNEDKAFKFELTFDKEGTFNYVIKEKKGTDAQITYDTTEYTVEITVTDEDGTLKADVLINGAADTSVVFTNKYTKPTPNTYSRSTYTDTYTHT